MTLVHIFWSKPMKHKPKIETLSMMLLSTLMAKKIYGRVELITDFMGREFVQKAGIPYNKIHLGLDDVDDDKGFVPAKVYAYKLMSKNIRDFLYLDYDVFLYEYIPNHEYIVQVDEGLSSHTYSIYHYCLDRGVEFPISHEDNDLRFFNMGLFKADIDVIEAYYELFFTTLYRNQHLYTKDFQYDQYTMFLEQNLIYMVLKKQGKLDMIHEYYPISKPIYNKYGWMDTPEKIRNEHNYVGQLVSEYTKNIEDIDKKFEKWFDTPSNFDAIGQTKYIHLAQYKNIPNVMRETIAYGLEHFPKEFSNLIYNFKNLEQ